MNLTEVMPILTELHRKSFYNIGQRRSSVLSQQVILNVAQGSVQLVLQKKKNNIINIKIS
jgi:hypothetical protein